MASLEGDLGPHLGGDRSRASDSRAMVFRIVGRAVPSSFVSQALGEALSWLKAEQIVI